MRAACLLLALLVPLAANAQAPAAAPAPQDRVLFLADHGRLDRGQPDWNEAGVVLSRHWSTRQVAELGLVHTRRFGLEDTRLDLGWSTPVNPQLTASVQASISPSHRVLPRHALGGQLQYEFAPGWLAQAGARHVRYEANDAEVNVLRLALEKYFGPFSVLAAWSPARALGQGTRTVELRGHYYYGQDSSLGLILARGDEATALGPGQVALADVRSVALLGRQELGPNRWLLWGVNRTRQGSFYTRTGATLGLQLAF
ncbi:YaiO family outer membrane beta-barrel protein [Ramlibacter tataouinensis]|uniref:YaiO family outer membrane beta-barrel protein n=1 Tax=Ramlibacter tataouinensis TaxID=94132 RepID=UPI0022F3BE14|nr:YaiO family outer membrane beta-barrel protein [Ramlibacter tataouinensis]WBY02219.1 YaiO family outer membrane beta-barrel protein [Ramlibacter tataouinensis]